MTKQIQVFKNKDLNLDVRTIKNEDGSISINAEDTARGFGWVDNSQRATCGSQLSKVRWARMNKYICELGFGNEFPHKCGKDDYIPESLFYLLAMKANNKAAQEFQKWLAVEVIPQIRKTGGYIPVNEEETEQDILAKALLIAQNTLKRKDELLKSKDKELEEKNRFINQLAASENSLLVREVAKVASKQNIVIGEKRLWAKLREWGLIFLKSTEPKQIGIDKGLFEVNEGTKEAKGKVFTYRTTRVTGKGQAYIIERLLKEGV